MPTIIKLHLDTSDHVPIVTKVLCSLTTKGNDATKKHDSVPRIRWDRVDEDTYQVILKRRLEKLPWDRQSSDLLAHNIQDIIAETTLIVARLVSKKSAKRQTPSLE